MIRTSLLGILLTLALFACNNEKGEAGDSPEKETSLLDSLEDQVWDGHDVGMAKYGKLRSMKLKAEMMIDSIARLPAAEKQQAADLRDRLTQLVRDLTDAKDGMDTWMRQFRDTKDSAKDDPDHRAQFLRDEILRVNKVRDDILNSLARADSLVN